MSLTSVKMSEEVWLTCATHAFSTETEEIMGLLLGDIQVYYNPQILLDFFFFKFLILILIFPQFVFHNVEFLIFQHSKNGSVTALIWGASPQTRSDRRKDRVETNPEQLAAASALADISFFLLCVIAFKLDLKKLIFNLILFILTSHITYEAETRARHWHVDTSSNLRK